MSRPDSGTSDEPEFSFTRLGLFSFKRCERSDQRRLLPLPCSDTPPDYPRADPPEPPIASPSLKVLTQREARIIRAIAETMFPPGETGFVSPEEARVVEYLDELLATVEPRERTLMRGLLLLFEVQSIVTFPSRPALFSRASDKARSRSLKGWDKSNLYPRRVAFQALRSLMIWAYVDNPVVEQAMGIERGTEIMQRLREQGLTMPADRPAPQGARPAQES
ncbi:MAG: hypothetical protein EA397_11525 [Deltaproteobacteria bacterium]|nr:MAG: hypothetical protein EA397_11525 [Deltaproteobacteria bacterium]